MDKPTLANQTLSSDLKIGDDTLPAGTYSIFTIPGEQAWTVIFNHGLGQNGTGSYKPEEDALRVQAPATAIGKVYQAFTIAFEDANGGADLVLMWDRTKVTVPLRTP